MGVEERTCIVVNLLRVRSHVLSHHILQHSQLPPYERMQVTINARKTLRQVDATAGTGRLKSNERRRPKHPRSKPERAAKDS